MKKIILAIVIVILVLGGAGTLFAVNYYKDGISAVSTESKEVVVTIENGQSGYSILNTLDTAGLINNALCGKIYLKLNGVGNIQANTYILNENMSIEELFRVLEHPSDEHLMSLEVTILDGNTIPQIAESIASAMGLDVSEVMNLLSDTAFLNTLIQDYWFISEEILQDGIKYPLEGYLYPETYKFNINNSLEDVIRVSLNAMDQYLSTRKGFIEAMDFTPHEFLTFASIVERESLFDEDRPVIAGVFKNRLADDMLLQSDITVNYAWDRTGVDVTYEHLEIDSPYNTYMYVGLPIGPISSVSEVTMEACFEYEHHDYYYFFAKEDGTVIYSSTYDEHLAAVEANKWY